MNNDKILKEMWITKPTKITDTETIGIIKTEDNITKEHKLYIGIVSGMDVNHDRQRILEYGAKYTVDKFKKYFDI